MLCPKCNTQIPDHYRFCPVCGNDLSAHNQAVQSSAYQTQSQNPGYNVQAPAAAKKPFKFLPWILLACGVLVVAAAAIVIIVLSDGSGSGNNMPIQPQVSNSSGTTSPAKNPISAHGKPEYPLPMPKVRDMLSPSLQILSPAKSIPQVKQTL